MSSNRPICVHCGARYGRRDIESIRIEWPLGGEMPAYRGNKIEVKGGWVGSNVPDAAGNVFGWRHVWDGVSWIAPYRPFCTLRCALRYARRAYAESKR